MAGYNKVVLMGNATRDAQLKHVGTQKRPLANFGLAMNEKWKNKEGVYQDRPCFVDIQAWDQQAEVAHECIKKGVLVFIEGSLKMDTWTTREGQKRSKLLVLVRNITLMTGEQAGFATQEPLEGELVV